MDKTVAEINAAYEAGQEIVFSLSLGGATYDAFVSTRKFVSAGSNFDFTGTAMVGDNLVKFATFNDLLVRAPPAYAQCHGWSGSAGGSDYGNLHPHPRNVTHTIHLLRA